MATQYVPVSLIGVPTDIGAGHRGARMGPEALRIAGLQEALVGRGVEVRDLGNLDGPRNPWQAPQAGYRHLDEVVAWNQALMDASYAELRAGRMPIMLGGDHCLGIGSITAVAKYCREQGRPLRVLWLDAHSDFNTSEVTPSGNVHGMPVACLCGLGPEALTHLGGSAPALLPEQVRQIGIRSVDPEEKRLIKQHRIDVYDMRYIDEAGMKRTMARLALARSSTTYRNSVLLLSSGRSKWYWRASVIRMSSMVSFRPSCSAIRRLARTTSVLPAAANSRLSSAPPVMPSAMPLSLSTSAAPTKPASECRCSRLSFDTCGPYKR